MKTLARLASLILLAGSALAQSTGEWQSLFNGKNLDGWRLFGSEKPPGPGWKVVDGNLVKAAGLNGGNIITEKTYTDFEFSWEWKIAAKGNNGVKYLVIESRKDAPGPEYQMLDDTGHPDGKNGTKRLTAALYDILPADTAAALKPAGQWNQSRILVLGNTVEHWLNDKKVLTYQLASDPLKTAIAQSKFKNAPAFAEKIPGHLMLTDHADECTFRNLRIRELKP
jgi:hypothetical protein